MSSPDNDTDQDSAPITDGWWETRCRYRYDRRDEYGAWSGWERRVLPDGLLGNLSYPSVLLSSPSGQREWRHHES